MECDLIIKFIGPMAEEDKEYLVNNKFSYGQSKSINGGPEIINAILVSLTTVSISELIKYIREKHRDKKILTIKYKGVQFSAYDLDEAKDKIEEIDDFFIQIKNDTKG